MKNKQLASKLKWTGAGLAISALLILTLTAGKPSTLYVAHEWGTFTSVQGADGILLDWHPLESAQLPGFVYNWSKPGLGRQPAAVLFPGKGAITAQQRIETPVIYFYADRDQKVDVSVSFPKGWITEWYPQATQIGPSTVPASPAISKLENCAHRAGIPATVTLSSLFQGAGAKESRAYWRNVQLLTLKQARDLTHLLPIDASGSHYFSARETDANLLRTSSLEPTNAQSQVEKFIFYRGVGNFSTPLSVTMDSSNRVTVINNDGERLRHLFLIQIENGTGSFVCLDPLDPGKSCNLSLVGRDAAASLESLSDQLSAKMAQALEHEGLYPREAAAMVHTWRDSWFTEAGVRVLYVLPRRWTEQTLELRFDPPPSELVRVMVGRAEVLTPALERRLADVIADAREGHTGACRQLRNELQKLGRFAEPALELAMKGTDFQARQEAQVLLRSAVTASNR
jgi:hypothetical protein